MQALARVAPVGSGACRRREACTTLTRYIPVRRAACLRAKCLEKLVSCELLLSGGGRPARELLSLRDGVLHGHRRRALHRPLAREVLSELLLSFRMQPMGERRLERLSFLFGRTARLGEHTLARFARHPACLRLGLHAGALDELTVVFRLRLPFGFGGSGGGRGCTLCRGAAHAPLILLQLVLRELAREHVVRVREGVGDDRQVEGVAQLHCGPMVRRGWRSVPLYFGRRR